MNTYCELQEQFHTFLISALDRVELPASCLSCFTPGKSPQYTLDRRLTGSQSWSGCNGKEKYPKSAPAGK